MVDTSNLGTSPDEVQFRFRDDEPVDHGTVTVDACCDQTNAAAVRIEPGDDARLLLPFLDRLALIDQLSHMRRCGFDSFAPDKRLDEDDAARAFATWDNVYQRAADRRATIADKRHEA
jgi:uncharacterized protein (DUF934 family)